MRLNHAAHWEGTDFRFLHGAHDKGTRFRFLTTLKSPTRGERLLLDAAEGGVSVIAPTLFRFRLLRNQSVLRLLLSQWLKIK